MRTHKQILEEFYDFSDSRVTFSLDDGSYYEGYMFELHEDVFTFFIGGPLSPDEPIEIRFSSVDLNSLCYFDELEYKYKSAIWKDNEGKWKISD